MVNNIFKKFANKITKLYPFFKEHALIQKRKENPVESVHATPPLAVKILFVTLNGTIWGSTRSAWSASILHEKVTSQVMIMCQQYKDRLTRDLSQLRKTLIDEDVPFSYYSYESLLHFSPHVIFVPVPYSDMLPPDFWAAVKEVKAKIVYIPYGFEMGGGGFNKNYQFNLEIHNTAWRIFARSSNHRKMFGRYKHSGSANVVVTGAPRQDQYKNLESVNSTDLEKLIRGRTAVLWTPHFSAQPDNHPEAWSSFLYIKDFILDLFEERQDTHFLIFRPHPLLFIQLRDRCGWTNNQIDEFKSRIKALENVYLDENPDYLVAFKTSHGIIADCGSFLLEYFLTSKPILYSFPPHGYGLNDESHILECVYILGTNPLLSLADYIDNLRLGHDPLKDNRKSALKELFYTPKEQTVGLEIIEHIVESIFKGDDFIPRAHNQLPGHSVATNYWKEATNSYLGSPEYYDRQEVALTELLEALGPWHSALDIGCSDGRFTFVLSRFAQHVTGIDISESLIASANSNLSNNSIKNVNFLVESIEHVRHCGRYDLISCCGVLSGFIDDIDFNNTLSTIRSLTSPGGIVVFKESLSLKEPKYTTGDSFSITYTAVYRNIDQYIKAIEAQGMRLVKSSKLGEDKANYLENHFFCFQLTK